MPLKPNSIAPDFTIPDQNGNMVSLSQIIQSGPVVLFFFPKAFTRVCTIEACSFREDFSFFTEHKIQLLGISHDPVETLERFRQKHHLPYPLLSDAKHTVEKLYKVEYPFHIMTRRVTYLIDKQQKILATIDNLLNGAEHTDFMKTRILEFNKMGKLAL